MAYPRNVAKTTRRNLLAVQSLCPLFESWFIRRPNKRYPTNLTEARFRKRPVSIPLPHSRASAVSMPATRVLASHDHPSQLTHRHIIVLSLSLHPLLIVHRPK